MIEQLTVMRGLIHAQKAAMLLGTYKDKLYRKAKAGEIPHYRVLGRLKLDPAILARWLEGRHVGMTVNERLRLECGLIDVKKTALFLGMHEDKLYKKAKAGEIPHYCVLGRVKFDPVILAQWLEDRKIGCSSLLNGSF
ncbi:MAG TPA: helix-turn-helix domain-containing protein [Alloacidobacterium sp.]|nr:helix-turn-helix domain-containing protein [Alloacidobacterium sp.]